MVAPTGEVLTGLVEQFGEIIIEAMHHVTSADKAYSYLKEVGYEITRDIVRNVWEDVGAKDHWSTVIETWGTTRPIPTSWVLEGVTDFKEGYIHYTKEQWIDPETREITDREHSWKFDRLMSYDDVEDAIEDDLTMYGIAYGQTLIGITPAGVMHVSPRR